MIFGVNMIVECVVHKEYLNKDLLTLQFRILLHFTMAVLYHGAITLHLFITNIRTRRAFPVPPEIL